jgi:hypothetical protein
MFVPFVPRVRCVCLNTSHRGRFRVLKLYIITTITLRILPRKSTVCYNYLENRTRLWRAKTQGLETGSVSKSIKLFPHSLLMGLEKWALCVGAVAAGKLTWIRHLRAIDVRT